MTDDTNDSLDDKELSYTDRQLKLREKGYKPGQSLGAAGWIPWIKEDLNPNDTVTFLCQDVLGTQGGVIYNGKDKGFVLDINDLTCSFHIGKINTVNRFFYNRYEAMVSDGIRLEEFKRGGPQYAPWDSMRWMYIPYASSFGMDLNGHPLRNPKWYEIDKDGIPVRINNMRSLAALYFDGDIDFDINKLQFAELVWFVFKTKLTNKVKKILGRK